MISKNNDNKGLADLLYCFGSLGHKTGVLFKELADKSTVHEIRDNLMKLSIENEENSNELFQLSNSFGGSKLKEKNCKQRLRSVCELTASSLEYTHSKSELSAKELLDILTSLESTGGAMHYLYNQAETFLYMSPDISKQFGVELEKIDSHLDLANKVEEHITLIEEIKAVLSEKLEQIDKANDPVFKYQRPDAWFHPLASE
ncbi:MAG: hypothetical protein WC325_05890 [Candidatus Bathyarchaeia archaeon]